MKDERQAEDSGPLDQDVGREQDPSMVALDALANQILKVPKSDLDKRVALEKALNKLKRQH